MEDNRTRIRIPKVFNYLDVVALLMQHEDGTPMDRATILKYWELFREVARNLDAEDDAESQLP
jgi:hypothetical protein